MTAPKHRPLFQTTHLPTPGMSLQALASTAILCAFSLAGLVLVGYALVAGGPQ